MKGGLQRKIVGLAGLYEALGMATEEVLVKRHRRHFGNAKESILSIFKKVAEIQQRGSILGRELRHSNFVDFEVIASLQYEQPMVEYSKIEEAKNSLLIACPICGKDINREILEEHISEELLFIDSSGTVRVTIDTAFGISEKESYFKAENGRELKELIYERFGITISNQALFINGRLLENKEVIKNGTVNLKYKKQY